MEQTMEQTMERQIRRWVSEAVAPLKGQPLTLKRPIGGATVQDPNGAAGSAQDGVR